MGIYRDFRNFSSTPYYLRNQYSYELQTWQVYLQGSSEQKPLKTLGEKERRPIQGLPKFLEYRPIISGTRTSTNFKFDRCIQSVHSNKSPLIICEKRERGRIQGLPKFFEHTLLSQEQVKLRTSNFVRMFLVSIAINSHYKFREK